MKKSIKILLGIIIPIIIIGAGFGGLFLFKHIKESRIASLDPPIIEFPVENIDVINIVWGYGYHDDFFHSGIDFCVNTSVNIIASCNVTVLKIESFYNELGGTWQTNVFLEYNEKYIFNIAFESTAKNETYSNLQREAISVTVGQKITTGEILGTLLYHGSGCHIDFGLHELDERICAYQYFSQDAKNIFDELWDKYGFGDESWYT
ncbi:MAG: M23 family metallopeptidase [Asgard group archaeon]|nr:M23 family metallopeptidase [Asgard group archaeon]